MSEQLALLPGHLTAHLQLALVALLLGAVVSVPLGVLVTRRRSLENPVLGAASVIQTIPSLALLAVMVPALAALSALLEPRLGIGLRSIGYLPAIVALTLYSTLPILRNTVTGIEGVDRPVLEAARGVGMTGRQQLWRVELPLAMPVIVAGMRTAAVWVVGTATLSTPVGATSLGNFIFSGLQTRNFQAVLVGCLGAAALALLLDQLIRLLEAGLRRRRRRAVAVASAGLLSLYAYTGATLALGQLGGTRPVLTVGSKTFTEQYILSEILVGVIERDSGWQARTVQSLGSTVLFDALRQGEVDVYVDYSGTLWATIMKRVGLPSDRRDVVSEVATYLSERHGIVLASALGFENTYALAMRGAQARALGIATIGELARSAPTLEIGADYEFFSRPEWTRLQAAYGLAFRARRSMDSSLMYQALAKGEVDVISAFSTDGRIAAYDLRVLDDERGVIPPYDAVVLVGPRLARSAPAVLAALRDLEGSIDAATMRALNRAVDRDGRAPAEVAREFLAERR